jgi:hypothetical protein
VYARNPAVLWLIVVVLVVLWPIGCGFHGAGNLIHGLLILALIFTLIQLLTGCRTV